MKALAEDVERCMQILESEMGNRNVEGSNTMTSGGISGSVEDVLDATDSRVVLEIGQVQR